MHQRMGVRNMPTFHLNSLPKEKRIQMIGEFYDTVDSLKDRQEVRSFFKSLLAADEIAALMRRIEVAMLLSAEYSYDKIKKMLGVGNNKISSVHKALLQDDSGYAMIVKRLIEDRKNRLIKIKKEGKGTIDEKELEREALLFTQSSAAVRRKK